jgi:hypothetical protein
VAEQKLNKKCKMAEEKERGEGKRRRKEEKERGEGKRRRKEEKERGEGAKMMICRSFLAD